VNLWQRSIRAVYLHADTGILNEQDACVVIVRTEWNAAIVDALEKGCLTALKRAGACPNVITVPGAFEIPFGIKAYWEAHKYKDDRPLAFIALGCVLRGDTLISSMYAGPLQTASCN